MGGAAPSSSGAPFLTGHQFFTDPHLVFAHLAASPRPVTGVAPAFPHSGRPLVVSRACQSQEPRTAAPPAWQPFHGRRPPRPACVSPGPRFGLFFDKGQMRGRCTSCPSGLSGMWAPVHGRTQTPAPAQAAGPVAGGTRPWCEVWGAHRSLLPKASQWREHHETPVTLFPRTSSEGAGARI